MIALDTSVVVAVFSSWHEFHETASERLADEKIRLPAHVLVESYSTLTRMPPPFRSPSEVVREFLDRQFPGAPIQLPGSRVRRTVLDSATVGIVGGAIYDGMVAATVAHAGLPLLTLDRRAARTYEAMAVDYEFLN